MSRTPGIQASGRSACDNFDWRSKANGYLSCGTASSHSNAACEARIMAKGALSNIAHYTAPLRRLGASSLARLVVLVIGLAAMTAFTIPELQKSASTWLSACLWCCLVYFAIEGAVAPGWQLAPKRRENTSYRYRDCHSWLCFPFRLRSFAAWRHPRPGFWIMWILKLAQNSPGFAQLGRVFVLEAKPLASVLALFLIVLFLASAGVHVSSSVTSSRAPSARSRPPCGGPSSR